MITDFETSYRLSDNLFREAKVIIERSQAAEMINDLHDEHRGNGGQDCNGIAYTISAVLVAALGLLMLGRTPTYKAIQQAIGDLSPRQLAEVGMAGQDSSRIFADRAEQRRERTRFVAWLNRRLAPLDPSPDQPARRITNAAHRRIIAGRSAAQRAASEQAAERLRTVLTASSMVRSSTRSPQVPSVTSWPMKRSSTSPAHQPVWGSRPTSTAARRISAAITPATSAPPPCNRTPAAVGNGASVLD